MNHLLKLIFALAAFGLIALALSCTANKIPPVSNPNSAKPSFHADFATQPAEVKAGEPATIIIAVKDASGAAVRNLDIEQEKPMHLIVVSSDLAEFYHIHPELQADGSYRVMNTLPNGGDYKLYADFTPPGADQVIARRELTVVGAARSRVALAEDTTLTKTVDGLRVTMHPDKPLRAGQELVLNFNVADAKSGEPVTDLQPYLGSLAHFVIISEDTTDFLHAHPMVKGQKMAMGDDHKTMPDANGAMKQETKDEIEKSESASEISAHTTFPRAGLYKIWAQFQRNGQVIIVPYIVRVPNG